MVIPNQPLQKRTRRSSQAPTNPVNRSLLNTTLPAPVPPPPPGARPQNAPYTLPDRQTRSPTPPARTRGLVPNRLILVIVVRQTCHERVGPFQGEVLRSSKELNEGRKHRWPTGGVRERTKSNA